MSTRKSSDEITLIDIGRIVFNFRLGIIIITLIFMVASTWYAFSKTDIFGAKVTIRPTDVRDIEKLGFLTLYHHFFDHADVNLTDNIYSPLKSAIYLYKQMILNLNSYKVRYLFENSLNGQHGELKSNSGRVSNLIVKYGHQFGRRIQDDDLIIVSIEGDDQNYLIRYLNDFIAFANTYTIKSFKEMLEDKIKNRRAAILNEIECHRIAAKQTRNDKIVRLREALGIAEKLGIGSYKGDKKLYHLGAKALKSEIKALQARKNDDPFILELPKLQAQIKQLSRLHFDLTMVNAAKVDSPATPHKYTTNRRFIIIIGTISGIMLGVFIAFIFHFIKNARVNNFEN